MLQDLYIEGFRGVRRIQLENLHPVNLIVGENDSGKTSVLEAIQLLKAEDVLGSLYEVAYKRENPLREPHTRARLELADLIRYTFYDQNYLMIQVLGVDDCSGDVRAEMRGETYALPSKEPPGDDESEEVCIPQGFRGEFHYASSEGEYHQAFDLAEEKRIRKIGKSAIPMQYLTPLTAHVLPVKTTYQALHVREKQKLIEVLQNFDDRIVGMEQASSDTRVITFLKLKDGQMMPMSVFGDGMKKILAITNAVIRAKGGIVLIDEFDTSIYKEQLPVTVDWLYRIADQYHVQMFLTTHSEAAMRALADSEKSEEMLHIYRLERQGNETYVSRRII